MTTAEIAKHTAHWMCGTASQLAYIALQVIPCGYVEIRRESKTGDEWLHYGTRWLNADITDTKVKLALRPERLEAEERTLHDIERQIRELNIIYAEQKERLKVSNR